MAYFDNLTRDEVNSLKIKFLKGTRVRLVCMGDDPHPLPRGIEGTVKCVDDIGTIHVNWDNGRTLGVVYPEDKVEIIGAIGGAEE